MNNLSRKKKNQDIFPQITLNHQKNVHIQTNKTIILLFI